MNMIDVGKLKYLGSGRNRAVYLLPSGKNVIKVPLNDAGQHDNLVEEYRYRKQKDKWFPLAKCRMLKNSNCLIMEYVSFPERYAELQEKYPWIDMVDCWQVGFTSQNKLVAYDYGL